MLLAENGFGESSFLKAVSDSAGSESLPLIAANNCSILLAIDRFINRTLLKYSRNMPRTIQVNHKEKASKEGSGAESVNLLLHFTDFKRPSGT
jgi:hypothetical protein